MCMKECIFEIKSDQLLPLTLLHTIGKQIPYSSYCHYQKRIQGSTPIHHICTESIALKERS